MLIVASRFPFPIQEMQYKQISSGWLGTILRPIDTTTLNSEPSQALLGSGICSWLKQRSLHQFLALMRIESVSHVHLLGAKGNVLLINLFNNPQILLISQNHFLHTVQYSVSLKQHSFFRHHISPKQLIIDMICPLFPIL